MDLSNTSAVFFVFTDLPRYSIATEAFDNPHDAFLNFRKGELCILDKNNKIMRILERCGF